jgi:hypothetical protein
MVNDTPLTGRHSGRAAAILCAGPSLRGFEFARLGDAVSFAVNGAGLTYPRADYLVFIDLAPFCVQGPLRELVETFAGEVLALRGFARHFSRPVIEFDEALIRTNRLAAGAAVNLAAAAGCDPIYLLGADYRLAADGAHHVHPGGRAYEEADFTHPRERLETVIAATLARGTVVINVTPSGYSRLKSRYRQSLAAFDLRP